MNYAPHQLYKKNSQKSIDENGDLISVTKSLDFVSPCRCDDGGTLKNISVNGESYTPQYHVVHEGDIEVGDEVIIKDGNEVRGSGKVVKTSRCNYYSYKELWI